MLWQLDTFEEQLKDRKNKSGTEEFCNVAIGGLTPYEPFNASPMFADLSDTFHWMPDTGVLDMDAWGFVARFWNMDCSASGPVL